jgi:hypothetical protein
LHGNDEKEDEVLLLCQLAAVQGLSASYDYLSDSFDAFTWKKVIYCIKRSFFLGCFSTLIQATFSERYVKPALRL